MKHIIPTTILYTFLIIKPVQINAQDKIEIEKRADPDQVPEAAILFIQNYFPEKKPKWIYEISETENTYEAKLKWKGKKLSIEFFKNGDFLDAELQIHETLIDDKILSKIKHTFNEDYQKYKVQKIQKQFSGEGDDAMKILLYEEETSSFAKINYEVIVWGKSTTEHAFFEYLFDEHGDFVKKQRLAKTNSDNLFY